MRTSPGWQPATKQGLQSYSHKKLERTSATDVHAVRPINTVDSARRDPEQGTQPCCTQSPDQIHINCVLFSHKWMFFLSHSMCSTLLCRKRNSYRPSDTKKLAILTRKRHFTLLSHSAACFRFSAVRKASDDYF